jgi:uncharacterized membrane protein
MAVTVDHGRAVLDLERIEQPRGSAARLDSIDFVRGLVMVIMALDHVRGFCSNGAIGAVRFDVTDLEKTTTAYFLTRWVTHFCAPTFVFLAGTGAFLGGARGKSKPALAWFLFSRGLWLAILELTLVYLGWNFNFELEWRNGAVIWAIGCSMMVLSFLVFLPTSMIATFGVAIMAFHNLFDSVKPDDFGGWAWFWSLMHGGPEIVPWRDLHLSGLDSVIGEGEFLSTLRNFKLNTGYPLLPWIGTMAAGYGFGAMMLLEPSERKRQLIGLGLALTTIFVVLRYLNVYGDPEKWTEQPTTTFTVLSFLKCWKYPPSLLYLLMTLGPAITLLGLIDGVRSRILWPFIVFGRVPLFYYLIHVPVIHGLAVGLDFLRFGYSPQLTKGPWMNAPESLPENYGFDLWQVYLIWIAVVVFLFPFCYAFSRLKRRYPGGILSYL